MANYNSPVFFVGIAGSRDRPEIFYGKSGPIRHAWCRSASGEEKWFWHLAGSVGNLVLQVTLYTPLKQPGLTTKLPGRTLTDNSYVLHGIADKGW